MTKKLINRERRAGEAQPVDTARFLLSGAWHSSVAVMLLCALSLTGSDLRAQ